MGFKPHACDVCGKVKAPFLHRYCPPCAQEQCKLGNHSWSPDAIGPGVFEASCLYCPATTNDGPAALETMGFVRLKEGMVVDLPDVDDE